jgi:O-antigen/teichoic acid export membrane protein
LGTALLLLLVVVFAETILQLYFGAAFTAASTPLRILLPGVFGFALARVLWPVIQARGNTWALLGVIAVATLTNVGLNVWLLPSWGATGAAFATCVSYGSVLVWYIWLLEHYGVQPLRDLAWSRLSILCALTWLLLLPVRWFVSMPLLMLLLGGLWAVASFTVGALGLGLLRLAEIDALLHSLPSPLRQPSRALFVKLQPWLTVLGAH